jgi:hypothetical protein
LLSIGNIICQTEKLIIEEGEEKIMKKLLVLLTAVAMVASFAAIASAAEFSFYGNARLHTFSWEDSKEVNTKSANETYYPHGSAATPIFSNITANDLAFDESDRDLDLSVGSISRFGTKITVSDELTANVEFGLIGKTASGGNTVYLRHLYGEYDFGAGKVLVGQYWHPFAVNVGYSNQVGGADDGLGSTGQLGANRRPQIRLSFGDFALHFMSPDHPKISGIGNGFTSVIVNDQDDVEREAGYASDQKYYDDDISWPHVAAVYNASYENFKFSISGSMQSYEVSDTRGIYNDIVAEDAGAPETKTGNSYDVDSHAFKVGLQGSFGLFTLGATYGFGQNLYNMGVDAMSGKGGAPRGATYDAVNDRISDVDTTAYTIVGSFKVNDMVTLEAGYGKVSNDVEGPQDDEASAYYLQAAIAIADGFTVTPEIGKYDYEENEDGTDEGDSTYFGAKWQINF